jgi:hypothetical protein
LKRDFPALLLFATVLCANAQAPQATNAGQANAPRPTGPASTEPLELPAEAGSNGAQMSLRDCLSQSHACQILAPALHAQAGAQPWGLGNARMYGIPVIGPKATDPKGCFTDLRGGPQQLICNQGQSLGDGRHETEPLFAQAITSVGNGNTPHAPSALSLQLSIFGGTRDFGPADETYVHSITNNMWVHSSASQYLYMGQLHSYAPGDSIPFFVDAYSVGQGLAQNEGIEWRARMGETGNVPQGKLNTQTCGSTCKFSLAQTQGTAGSWGNDLALIDVTQGYNAGYISNIRSGTFTSSGSNWDATFGDTTATTTTTAAVSNASGGNAKLNMFPQSNVTLSLVSSAGFSTGQTACMFDKMDPSWQCSHITAVPDGTHITVDVVNYPLSNNSTVAAGGLTGYGFGMDADWAVPGATNGMTVIGDEAPNGIIRQVYPIISNASGNTLTIYTGSGVNQNINTRSYHSAAGAGGTASVTVSGGTVTACAAAGGSGYSTANPPSLAITGITYTAASMVYPTVTSGALSGCTVLYAGAGIAGTPVAKVNPNPYHIYPQGRTLNVYNGDTGAVDGSAIVTTPVVGKFSAGDTLEQPHYFRIKISGLNFAFNNYQEGGQHFNMVFNTSGSFGTNDYEAQFINGNDPTLYSSYPALTTPMPGRGQLGAPYGLVLGGPHRDGLVMKLPPYGGNGNSMMGAVVVECGTAEQCAAWNTTYPILNAQGWNSTQTKRTEDILGYNPVTQTWTLTAGAKNNNGGSSSCALSFGPSGLSLAGPNCASHITMRNSAELRTDRPARLLPALAESRTASALAEDERSVADAAAESDAISINGVSCAPGSPCTVLPSSNVPAWLQYLGTGADGANTNASGALSGEKFYTDFTVPSGKTVTVDASKGGLVVHATGACTIAGSIVASGEQNNSNNSGVTGGSGGGGGGGAAAGVQGKSSYPTIAASGYGAADGGAFGAAQGGAAGNGASMPGSLIRAFSNSGGGVDGLYLQGAGGGQGANSGGAGGTGGGGVVLICASISGNDGAYNGVIDTSGGYGNPAAADATGAGGGGGGGAVILSSQAKVKSWPAVHAAGGPGALASVPQALATGGSCTSRPKIALGVASGALSSCTVAQAGAGCGAGTGVVWNIVGGGGAGGTITATWSGGALQSCQAQGGAGYTAATYATAGAGGDGGNGWSAKFQGW